MKEDVIARLDGIPNAVYNKEDFADIDAKWRKCLIYSACYLALAAVVVGWTFAARIKPATMLAVVALGCAAVFLWGMKVSPIRLMRKYMYETHSGLTKRAVGRVTFFAEDVTPREGIECRRVILNVGEKDDPNDERLFYWNAALPCPPYQLGCMAEVTSHGNDIIGFVCHSTP